MGFWIFMLCCDLLLPLMLIGFGQWFIRRPPEKINVVFGYRTTMSMKNQDTWTAAQRYCGHFFYKSGMIALPVTIVILLFVLGKSEAVIGDVGGTVCILQLGMLIGAIVYTEYALHREFDKSGRKRNKELKKK